MIPTGYQGDYRRTFNNTFSQATWTFNDLNAGTYDVFATWHHGDEQTPNINYVILGDESSLSVPVNQRFEPANDLTLPLTGGLTSRFQLLGQMRLDTNGQIQIVLNDLMSGGTVTTDAVVLRTSELPQPSLQRVNLKHNPLNEVAYDFGLQSLIARSLALQLDPDQAPVVLLPPGPQVGQAGNVYEYPDLINEAFGISDNDSGWLVVGAGDSSEVLRFNGHLDPSRGGFAEVLAQLKTTTGTQPVLTGGGFDEHNNLFVVDAALGRVLKIDSANGTILDANTGNVSNGRDLAVWGQFVFVPNFSSKQIVRFNASDLSMVEETFAPLPVDLVGNADYSLTVGPSVLGNDLFLAYHTQTITLKRSHSIR